MTPQELRKLNEIYDFMQKLKSSTTIPFEVGNAFEARISVSSLKVSSKDLDSEDQAVNEGGSGSYAVMGDPDGFLETIINGTTCYLPYFHD